MHPPIYKVDICSNTKNKKHIEAWAEPLPTKAPPPPIASDLSSDFPKQLPQQMKEAPPTPGPTKMAQETWELLLSPIKVGSKKFKIHPKDIAWFLGFSPRVVGKAIDIASKESWQGKRVSAMVPYLFKICCNIRKKQ